MSVCDVIKNRYEYVTVLSATMCNPNGDPDMGNAPRTDWETEFGYITDKAIKRWIRNYVQYAYRGEKGMEIFIQNKASLNKKIAEAVLTVNGVESSDQLPQVSKKPVNRKVEEASDYLCDRYWDCRTFGAVANTGLNAGQITGAVQVDFPLSIEPVQTAQITITRMSYADAKDTCKTVEQYENEERMRPDDKKRTMGNQQLVYFGMYVLRGSISVAHAERVGFTERDLQIFCEGLVQMLAHNVSSSKSGMRLETPVILFKHVGTQPAENVRQNEREARLGCVPVQKLYNLLKIEKKDGVLYPRSSSDYNISFDLSGLPRGVEVGFKEMPFEDFTWGDEIRERDFGIEIK